jgi:hypothetical protein
MAQSNKSRIVIWTIVGIMVVVAVILLVTRPKTTDKLPFDAAKFTNQMTTRMDKFEVKVNKARGTGAPEAFAKVDEELGLAKTSLGELGAITDSKEQMAKKDEVMNHFVAARKAYKEATGKEDTGN